MAPAAGPQVGAISRPPGCAHPGRGQGCPAHACLSSPRPSALQTPPASASPRVAKASEAWTTGVPGLLLPREPGAPSSTKGAPGAGPAGGGLARLCPCRCRRPLGHLLRQAAGRQRACFLQKTGPVAPRPGNTLSAAGSSAAWRIPPRGADGPHGEAGRPPCARGRFSVTPSFHWWGLNSRETFPASALRSSRAPAHPQGPGLLRRGWTGLPPPGPHAWSRAGRDAAAVEHRPGSAGRPAPATCTCGLLWGSGFWEAQPGAQQTWSWSWS